MQACAVVPIRGRELKSCKNGHVHDGIGCKKCKAQSDRFSVEHRSNLSVSVRKTMSSPELRAELSRKIRAALDNPEERRRRSKESAARWAYPAYRAAQRAMRPRCVYCGAIRRKINLVPDGPGKYACADQTACEARILKQAA